ncbi:cytosolic nonspecific dipeptidase [Galdieria sulphuraria]|uniref:Cytosolic nonspecific dipeptidase n=1 Tax=Galdieria sulphuraria TaxID=130081 RepID=M2WZ94_GALSU|nr:cytosolic nonspecific dipeptidase [Galdieria sulphuraria]EME29390.1 cytosolic nonspecific dipeptidase [Galdieria sulphuraria]|eukprot:XP_005705910.1 cytosolic nonspecific dipeptidase [Galdieria sulphuraria]
MELLFNYVNQHSEEYIHRLREAVALDSVSSDPCKRSRCVDMAHYICNWIERLGGKSIIKHVGKQKFADGQVLDYPPIIFGDFCVDQQRPVVLAYCHYDVQPADIQDGWRFNPFELVEEQGKLYGRGATDDKGPLLDWLWAIEAHRQLGIPLPVNLLLCFEGMEESGSFGLDKVIEEESKGILYHVKYVCITDNYWLTEHRPCLTYGLRGIVYFQVHVRGPQMDLHSGLFGGLVHEPMNDLTHLLGTLTDNQGNILIPKVMDSVAPVTKEEESIYERILFDPEQLRKEAGQVSQLRESDKVKLLMNRWRFPSLSIHGIQGDFSGQGEKTVIPCAVTGKFSIRLVPHQQPQEIAHHVENFLKQQFAQFHSGNELQVEWRGASPWLADYHNSNFTAARLAFKKVYQVEPDLTREGGSIPITNTFQEYLGGEICLIPLGSPDDGAHSQNEKMNKLNYIEGIKVIIAYMNELAKQMS